MKSSVVLERKPLALATPEDMIPTSSGSSMIHAPCICADAWRMLSSETSVPEYHSRPSRSKSVDLPHPVLPTRTSILSNFTPGRKIRATAALSQRMVIALLSGVSSAPSVRMISSSALGTPSHVSPSRYRLIG